MSRVINRGIETQDQGDQTALEEHVLLFNVCPPVLQAFENYVKLTATLPYLHNGSDGTAICLGIYGRCWSDLVRDHAMGQPMGEGVFTPHLKLLKSVERFEEHLGYRGTDVAVPPPKLSRLTPVWRLRPAI
ncbi:hypothetical protein J6590_017748 [Homalodisca vitripennis]|nr:hypothetical protein J6590_017748 [Homalodisca vitripennis]